MAVTRFEFDDDQPVQVAFTDRGLHKTFCGTLHEFLEQHLPPSSGVTLCTVTFLFDVEPTRAN